MFDQNFDLMPSSLYGYEIENTESDDFSVGREPNVALDPYQILLTRINNRY